MLSARKFKGHPFLAELDKKEEKPKPAPKKKLAKAEEFIETDGKKSKR